MKRVIFLIFISILAIYGVAQTTDKKNDEEIRLNNLYIKTIDFVSEKQDKMLEDGMKSKIVSQFLKYKANIYYDSTTNIENVNNSIVISIIVNYSYSTVQKENKYYTTSILVVYIKNEKDGKIIATETFSTPESFSPTKFGAEIGSLLPAAYNISKYLIEDIWDYYYIR